MKDSNAQQNLANQSSARRERDEVRFWQAVSLSLAIFALGLIASLLVSLVVMLMSR